MALLFALLLPFRKTQKIMRLWSFLTLEIFNTLKANVMLKVYSDQATHSSSSGLYLSTIISTLSLSVIFVGVAYYIIMSLRVLWLQSLVPSYAFTPISSTLW